MQYIVFDLEWNQCPQGKAKENPRIPFEIVEIGALKLNEERETIDSFHEVIRPLVYHRLHFRTKEVIHLTQEELDHARTFSPVVRDFLEWCGEEPRFVTWGCLDLNELQRNMDYYRIPNTLPSPLLYYDLQKLFSLCYDDGKLRRSLNDAVEYLEIPETRPFHGAFDDTYYTAEIMRRMDFASVARYESVDYHRLPASRKEEISLDFGTYTKYVSRRFADKEEAMADRRVTSLRCPRCSRPVRGRVKWFSTGGSAYLSLVQCPRHGYIKGKIRLKKSSDGGVFVVKTVKPIDEKSAKRIREKRESVRKRRKERRRKRNRENEDK